MKKLAYILLVTSILSCNSEQTEDNTVNEIENTKTEVSETKGTEFIIGERIDGPANIRNKPNGEILFELRDNALVEVATKSDNGWYKILIYADIDYNEYEMDSIQKGRPIILDNDTIGEILKSHDVSTGQGGDFAYAMLFGYTHENNIKPETVIENVFKKKY